MSDNARVDPTIAVVTPSYLPDLPFCEQLSESVLRFTAPHVTHHILVPRSDMAAFSRLAGSRTVIHDAGAYLPRSFIRMPSTNVWLNSRRPFPPVRGWIAQQIVKLAFAASLEVDVALVVDSDVALIRPLGASDLTAEGVPLLYRTPGAIHSGMPRHIAWHRVAHRLLGLQQMPPLPLVDYISCPCIWSPSVVRELIEAIERNSRRSWQTQIASQLHFSEMTLYGVYLDAQSASGTRRGPTSGSMHCLNHYLESPLEATDVDPFLGRLKPDDYAVMISAKSGTSMGVRAKIFELAGDSLRSSNDAP